MKPHDVMQHPLNVLSDAERKSFFSDGFLVLPNYVPQAWLTRLREATSELPTADRQRGGMGGHCTRVAGRGRALRYFEGPARRWRPSGMELPIRAGGHRNCHGGGRFRRTPFVSFFALSGKLGFRERARRGSTDDSSQHYLQGVIARCGELNKLRFAYSVALVGAI